MHHVEYMYMCMYMSMYLSFMQLCNCHWCKISSYIGLFQLVSENDDLKSILSQEKKQRLRSERSVKDLEEELKVCFLLRLDLVLLHNIASVVFN